MTTKCIPSTLISLVVSAGMLLIPCVLPATGDDSGGSGSVRRGVRRAELAWPRWQAPEEAGFSSATFAEAERRWYLLAPPSVGALFVVYKGKVLASFGNESFPFWCHSVRKSFLSALYGVPVDQGVINLESTMEELDIDDAPPITADEKQARVVDLLRARSGVYHEAACEAQEARDARPERGSHPPGTFFYYNNWDFNALGTIYRQETGLDIFQEFQDRIAKVVGMQDFHTSLCEYEYEYHYSYHPCYKFRMSARDRARFGQLFLQKGRWGRRQVVPEAWVEESTRVHSPNIAASEGIPGWGYGYMWHVQSPEFFQVLFTDPRLHQLRSIAASGYGGQVIMILPDAEIVLVQAVDVYAGIFLDMGEVAPILEMILSSGPIVDLRMAQVTTQQSAVAAGGSLYVETTTTNPSAMESRPTTVTVSLVSESRPDEGPVTIGGFDLPALDAAGSEILGASFPIPHDLPPGRYLLIASVDDHKSSFDLSRDNNLKVASQSVEIH